MPRFHFNIHNGLGLTQDDEGRDLADLEEAKAEALKGARSLLAAEVEEGRLDLSGRIEVTDERQSSVFTLPFREAVRIENGRPANEQGGTSNS